MPWSIETRAKIRAQRRRDGVCVQCGREPAAAPGVLCAKHRDAVAARSAAVRAVCIPPTARAAIEHLKACRAAVVEIQRRPFSQRNGVDHVHAQRELGIAVDAALAALGHATEYLEPEDTDRSAS